MGHLWGIVNPYPGPTAGIFPTVPKEGSKDIAQQDLCRAIEGWQNYKSAEEESRDLDTLVEDYVQRGFCHIVGSMAQAAQELGGEPVLNKLGVITKFNPQGVKKSRIIWDLKESRANQICHQGERMILLRLLDVAQQAIRVYRDGQQPWLAAVDVKDAFMNVPSGADKRFTVAARPKTQPEEGMEIIVFDTLVFGAGSSPTIWGRFAAWLGRSCAAIVPDASTQIYVDDPIFVLAGGLEQASTDLTTLMLWFAIAGFPVKLSKAEGGKAINWVGARLELDDEANTVTVTIPTDKVGKLKETTDQMLRRPVIGKKQLRSYAGSLSFVAGLVTHLRPFLSSIWAALGSRVPADDGEGKPRPSGKLVHARRIRPALKWIQALIGGKPAPLSRVLESCQPEVVAEITSPWGIGGILKVDGKATKYFTSDIPTEALSKFKAQTGCSKFDTLWEGLALLVAFRHWLPELKHTAAVRARSDNLGVLHMLAKGGAASSQLNVLAREFALDQALRSYRIHWLCHLPGVTNLEADALSRQTVPVAPKFPEHLRSVAQTHVSIGPSFWKVDL